MRTAEDALKDPRPGDVVRVGGRYGGTYLDVTETDLPFRDLRYFTSDGREVHTSLAHWHSLTSDAEVLHVAQEGGGE